MKLSGRAFGFTERPRSTTDESRISSRRGEPRRVSLTVISRRGVWNASVCFGGIYSRKNRLNGRFRNFLHHSITRVRNFRSESHHFTMRSTHFKHKENLGPNIDMHSSEETKHDIELGILRNLEFIFRYIG